MNNSNSEFTNESVADIGKKYIDKTIQYYKLKLLKSLTEDISSLVKLVLIVLFSTILLIFLSISLAIYLGNLLSNNAIGYLIVSGIYLIILLFIVAIRKKIEKRVLLKMNKYFN